MEEQELNGKLKNEYRYYIFDYLIGGHLLTLDTVENKYRIDTINIHGQCSTLNEGWKKITKATINKALNRTGYVFDSYVKEYFTNDSKYMGDNDKSLLYRTDNYDDCILFLVSFAKENHNWTNNEEFNYYQKYLFDKTKSIENFKLENQIYSLEAPKEIHNLDRSKIKADKQFIEDLITSGALDDIDIDQTPEDEFNRTVKYWQEHYFDDYSDNELKEMIKNGDSTIIQENIDNEEEEI